MALNRCAAELEFDILEISTKHSHLASDVALDRRRFLQALVDLRKLFISDRLSTDLNRQAVNAVTFLLTLSSGDRNRLCDGR